ncbi:MAG: hypothetical protein HYX75_15470 [Acidobacteria bacterium]|nr:hypothetical protein [Acidobacteriota bacterium]
MIEAIKPRIGRRTAISAIGVAAAGLVVSPLLSALDTVAGQADATVAKYKGTRDGKILESTDGGKTWQVVANFGKEYSIRAVVRRRRNLVATLKQRRRSFEIKSLDARTWYTMEWRWPST